MNRYDTDKGADAVARAAEGAGAALVRSMERDRLTRLAPGADGESCWVTPQGVGSGGGSGGGAFRAADVARMREMTDDLRRVMFPGFFEADPMGEKELASRVMGLCVKVGAVLREEVCAVLRYGRRAAQHGCERVVREGITDAEFVDLVVTEFMRRLPDVRRMLALDVQAAYDGDPAAGSLAEIIFAYPGLRAITVYRIAHELHLLGVPLLPRIMTEWAHMETGIDIHP